MQSTTVKIILSIGILFALGSGVLLFLNKTPEVEEVETEVSRVQATIGYSVEGRDIESYTYGTGPIDLLFVGGVHGGYEWNSTLLAYRFIDYLEENLNALGDEFTITVIPSANPDGLYRVIQKEGRFTRTDVPEKVEDTVKGRFNANQVDLNRNFDCKWEPESNWRGTVVSAGEHAFSEPEAVAIRDVVLEKNPQAVIFWHSKANTVYASECEGGVLEETERIMNVYAKAAEYNTVLSFDVYEITGDAEGWLASINIPAITVELETHQTIEWERNLKGITALFNYYRTEN